MFPGTGPSLIGFFLWARWNPGTKHSDVIITKNGTIITKPSAGKGGAKADKGAIKA